MLFLAAADYKSLNSQVSTYTIHKDTLQQAPQGWHGSVQSQSSHQSSQERSSGGTAKLTLAHTQQNISLQQRLFTYCIFLRVADFHPEDVIQQPVNGFVLIEHQDELHNQAQIQRLEHFS